MTRHQYLLDRYEDAYFALLMYELILSRRHQRGKICKHYKLRQKYDFQTLKIRI